MREVDKGLKNVVTTTKLSWPPMIMAIRKMQALIYQIWAKIVKVVTMTTRSVTVADVMTDISICQKRKKNFTEAFSGTTKVRMSLPLFSGKNVQRLDSFSQMSWQRWEKRVQFQVSNDKEQVTFFMQQGTL